jgi:ABC-2 type transport system permease protein
MQRLDERGRGSSGALSAGIGFGLAFLLYFAILVFGQNVMRGVMEEKQTRTAEVVVSSVKPETLLAGKVIGVAGVGLTQQVIWMGASVYLLAQLGPLLTRLSSSGTGATAGAAAGSPAPVSAVSALPIGLIALVIVFFVLGITFYCTLYAAVGAMVNSEQEAQQAALPVMLLVVTSFLFVQPITFAPNGKLARVMSVLPFSSPIVMPLRLSVIPVSAYEVALSLISTIGGCVLATWVAARIYRVGLLMYGKRPSFAEVARWVRLSNR